MNNIAEESKQLADAKLKFIDDVIRELKTNEGLYVGNSLQVPLSTEPSLIDNNEILERFQKDENIGVDDQVPIADAVNRLIVDAGQNVLIHRDKGNDSWVCLHCKLINGERKIVVFIPILLAVTNSKFYWKNFNNFKTENDEKIASWLRQFNVKNPAELFTTEECKTSNDKSEQFLLAMVYAFGCCLNFPKCYLEPFGKSDCFKEKIRRAISKALMQKRMPTFEELWGEPEPER